MSIDQQEAICRPEAEEIDRTSTALRSYHSSVREKYKKQLDELEVQREAVWQLRSGLSSATRGTHIGASQCREALETVEEKLTKAINKLINL